MASFLLVLTEKMADASVINDLLKEEKLIELWPEYSCLFNVSSPDFKNRDKRDLTYSEIAEKMQANGTYCILKRNFIWGRKKLEYILRKLIKF